MSRLLEATCAAGVVTVEGFPVPSAEILSGGVGPSEGFVILDGDKAYYVANTTPDLKTTLDKLTSALTAILAAISATNLAIPTLATAPTVAQDLLDIGETVLELSALKETLK